MLLLNVGGNSKDIPLPLQYAGYEHHLLDIDPTGSPDICCDAQELYKEAELEGKYDAIYCSHNLEHYYNHKVPDVLKGFMHVLKSEGVVEIHVPHILSVIKTMIGASLDIHDPLYRLGDGAAISSHDIIFGWGKQIKESGVDFFAHKTAFTPLSLGLHLSAAGFVDIQINEEGLNLSAMARKP